MRFPRTGLFVFLISLATLVLIFSGAGVLYGAYLDILPGGLYHNAISPASYIYDGAVGASVIFLGIIGALFGIMAVLNKYRHISHSIAILSVGVVSIVIYSTLGYPFNGSGIFPINYRLILELAAFAFSMPAEYYRKMRAMIPETA